VMLFTRRDCAPGVVEMRGRTVTSETVTAGIVAPSLWSESN